MQGKCNKQKILWFDDTYGIHFTRETEFQILSLVVRIPENSKNS